MVSSAPRGPARDALLRLPKAELHCHLDGSARPQTLIDLAQEYGRTMPRADAPALAEYMTVRDARNLEEYLARFTVTLSNWNEPIRLVIPSKAVPISKTGLE